MTEGHVTASPMVQNAIDQLLTRFEKGDYNPTPIIDLGVLVASADGQVVAEERAALREIFQAMLGTNLTAETVDHLIDASLEVLEVAGVGSRARLIAEILVDCDAVEPGIIVALAVAFAAEGLSAGERERIEIVADAAGMPQDLLAATIEGVRETLRVDSRP